MANHPSSREDTPSTVFIYYLLVAEYSTYSTGPRGSRSRRTFPNYNDSNLTVKSGIRNRDLLLRKILKRRVDQNQTSFYSLVQGKLARCGAASIWQHYCIRLDQEHRIIADPISNSNEIPSLVSVFLMRVRY